MTSHYTYILLLIVSMYLSLVGTCRVFTHCCCYGVAICLGTLRMSHHAIKQKVLQCDEELSEQALSQLLKFLPGPEEVCVMW